MAVLAEAISVVIRRSRIKETYPGGWDRFVADCPNQTLCADGALARVGFMAPDDVGAFVRRLEALGFRFISAGSAVDLAVVDQHRGPTTACDWLEFGQVEVDGDRLSMCRMVGDPENTVFTPEGWRYEDSLSARHRFIPGGEVDSRLELLRHQVGIDVYRDKVSGQQVYAGRTSRPTRGR